jgi:hypothetical protein
MAEPIYLTSGAHPANLGGCLSHLVLMGNPTYRALNSSSGISHLGILIERFTVAGQRRIFTELPPLVELFSCDRTKPQWFGVGN